MAFAFTCMNDSLCTSLPLDALLSAVRRCRRGLLNLPAAGAPPYSVRSNYCYSNSITFNSYPIDIRSRLHAVVGQPSLKV